MTQGTLLPNPTEVKLISLRPKAGVIEMQLRACRSDAVCPSCSRSSQRVHSRYVRVLGDLPWEGLPVRIILEARRFFCREPGCARRIFAEPLSGTVGRYARRSVRLSEALHWVTLSLGGEAGARLAGKLGLLVSGSSLLRHLRRRARSSPLQAPRVLGIDDWAWRKGHRYGTILCDLEQRRVVDLLPDREAETVGRWLEQHPGAAIVSRDRASSYAEAVRRAAPGAVQVADRWHLLRNLSEALRRALEPHSPLLRYVARRIQKDGSAGISAAAALPSALSHATSATQQNRTRRYGLYKEMKALADAGVSQTEIARQLELSLRTVQRWIAAGTFPERTARSYPHSVDSYAKYLDARLLQGCRNVSQLWRELREQGYPGQLSSVWNWLRQHRRQRKQVPGSRVTTPKQHTSPQHAAWLMLKEPPSAKAYLEELYRASSEVAELARLGKEFFRIVRNRDVAGWPQWLDSAQHTGFHGFATGLLRDQHAVVAALTLPWSNGPVEGQVHRLKLIKRQMYGRASFDLLRLRVLHQA
jgi:transposase